MLLEQPPCSVKQHPNLLQIVQGKGMRPNLAQEIIYPLDRLHHVQSTWKF